MILCALLGFVLLGQSDPVQAIRLTPTVVAEIDINKLKGRLVRQLAWSPDGSQIYLMTYEPNRDASIKEAFHFLIPSSGGTPKRVDVQPDWAAAYWAWKAAQTAPGEPALKIEAADEKRRENAIALPFGGEYARGGTPDPTTGMSREAAMEAARGMETYNVYMLRLKGQTIGEWINHPIVPGLTFGWGPKGTGLIAFAELKSGRLILMDRNGSQQKVENTKNVVLPAWTEDGARLAYLEGRGRGTYALVVAAVQK